MTDDRVQVATEFQAIAPEGAPLDYARDEWQEVARLVFDAASAELLDIVRAAVRGQHPSGVEFMPARRHWRKLWLTSDPEGPGYARRKVYGRIAFDHEEFADLDEDTRGPFVSRYVDRLRLAAKLTGEEIARHVASEVAARADGTFAGGITVRSMPGMLFRIVDRTGATGGLIVNPLRDEMILRLASYFHVAPHGDELTFEEA